MQANRQEAHATWQTTVNSFEKNWPRLARFMENSESDVLAYMDFPQNHRSKIYSTNPLERLNKEVKRRSAVGIFPCEISMVRRIGAVLMEQNDEWLLRPASPRSWQRSRRKKHDRLSTPRPRRRNYTTLTDAIGVHCPGHRYA